MSLFTALLLSAALLGAQDSADQPRPSSPRLAEHVDACQHGITTLESLREHLAPPRHRMEAVVSIDSARTFHGPRPDSLRTGEVTQTVRAFELGPRAGSAWRIDVQRPDEKLRVNDSFAIYDEGRRSLGPIYGADALREQILARAAFPATLVDYFQKAGRVIGATDSANGGTHVLVELHGGRALIKTARLPYAVDGVEVQVPGLLGVEWLTHHPLLGDVIETLRYAEEPGAAPGVVSGWSVRGPLGAFEAATVQSVSLDSSAPPFPGGLYPDPESAHEPPSIGEPAIELRQLGEGTFELLCAEHASRSVAVDLGRGWAVIEAPVNVWVGQALIRALEEEKPGHPFLFVCASHHHPHYIGGMRPFLHRGATIVCPADVQDYVRHVMERPRTLQPDELALSRREFEIIGVERGERWAPPGAEPRLVAVEADGQSNHTEAFLVFFLPENRLAFGGDLLWIAASGEARGPNPRTRGLAQILGQAEDLGAAEFLTSWPAGGSPVGGTAWLDRASIREISGAR